MRTSFMISEIVNILAFFALLGLSFIIMLWIYAYKKTKHKSFTPYTPTAVVIIPCKQETIDFKKNIQSFLKLNYTFYRIVFVVDSKKDSVYTILHNETVNKKNVDIICTKPLPQCSGKVAALLTAIQSCEDVEILVFADSDIKVEKNWLRDIILPLQDKKIGASTGYRWYVPTTLKTTLISAWNMIPIVFMFYSSLSFTWGGSTAIRKKVFQQLQIKKKWNTAFSDDLVLTNALKKAGYRIYFQPTCIMKSPPEQNLQKFLMWGARQYTWVRWYNPLFWVGSFIGFVGLQIIIILGVLLGLTNSVVTLVLISSIIILEMFIGLTGIIVLSKTMIFKQNNFSSKCRYFLLSPLVFIMIAITISKSLFTQKISWAGKMYSHPKKIKKK